MKKYNSSRLGAETAHATVSRFVMGCLCLSFLVLSGTSVLAQQGKTRKQAQARKNRPLDEQVQRKGVTIWSDGTRMLGDLYLPKELKKDERLPTIVFIAGTGGTKKGFPQKLGTLFAMAGYAFLAFDYRGWGESDSKLQMLDPMPEPGKDGMVTVTARAIRWQMDFSDQVADIRNAIAFVSGEPHVDSSRIGILGTSYGGGLTVYVAAHDPRVKASAAQVPGMGGGRGPKAVYRAYVQQTQRSRAEAEPVPYKTGAPGGKMSSYAHMRYNTAKGIGYSAIEAAELIKTPMLIIDAGSEELMDITKNGGLVAKILKKNGVDVTYHIYPDIAHYGIYRERLVDATKMEIEFFDKHLKTKKD
ncbi:MAG TPA: hypothetical protein EYQ50_07485 [Verrucomicrobiales bacterium]|nr:hypothetical protein [Verrucomicrobiales bacterium]HIL68229.1 hypothetical protein [Verrucomicrobiota bacterium]